MAEQPVSDRAAYAKGYAAGRKRTHHEVAACVEQLADNAIWNRVFLSLLPVAMTVDGWVHGDEKIQGTDMRIQLAERWADKAVSRLRPEAQ